MFNHLSTLKNILEDYLSPYEIKCHKKGSTQLIEIYIKTGTLSQVVSLLVNLQIKSGDELRIIALNNFYSDCDTPHYPNVKIEIVTPNLLIPKEIVKSTYNTYGLDGIPEMEPASHGTFPGAKGADGQDGNHGMHGGHLLFIANNIPEGIKVVNYAGSGAKGQKGGDGACGKDGVNGEDGKLDSRVDMGVCGMDCMIGYGKDGTPGSIGGESGYSGKGGEKGRPGQCKK